MSLFTALDISTSGLTAQRQRVEVASSNLSNTETSRQPDGSGAYRRKDVVFQTMSFGKAMQQAGGGSVGVEVAAIVDDPKPFDRRFEPGHPDADKEGYVNYPNINSMEEMSNMMSAARSYEANIAAISIVKSMINRTLDIAR